MAEALGPVVEAGGHAVLLQHRVGVHHHEALLPQLVVARQHVDAVRVDAAQVGAHHELGGHRRALARHLHGAERVRDEDGEALVIDDDRGLGHGAPLLRD